MDTIQPLLPLEVANVWRLWKAGIVRENYARADEPGVVIVFELDSVEQAKGYVAIYSATQLQCAAALWPTIAPPRTPCFTLPWTRSRFR
jgi:hypothetical protein